MVNVAIYLDLSSKEDTGPVEPMFIGHHALAARPMSNEIIIIGTDRYWVQRIEMRSGEPVVRAYVGRG